MCRTEGLDCGDDAAQWLTAFLGVPARLVRTVGSRFLSFSACVSLAFSSHLRLSIFLFEESNPTSLDECNGSANQHSPHRPLERASCFPMVRLFSGSLAHHAAEPASITFANESQFLMVSQSSMDEVRGTCAATDTAIRLTCIARNRFRLIGSVGIWY
jgi:hypothetical protein